MDLLIAALIIGIVVLIVGGIRGYYENSPRSNIFIFFGTLITIISIVLIVLYDKPTALDVYRGKTALQITYQDSIPVDSVVVFKEK